MKRKILALDDRVFQNIFSAQIALQAALRDNMYLFSGEQLKQRQAVLLRLEAQLAPLALASSEEAELINQIKSTGFKGQVKEIGAGIKISDAILEVPGVSKFFVGGASEYLQTARDLQLYNTLGHDAAKYSSVVPEVSSMLANASYVLSRQAGAEKAFGLGVTAATATDRQRKGQAHFYMTLSADGLGEITLHGIFKTHLNVDSALGERDLQQEIVKKIGLRLLKGQLSGEAFDAKTLLKNIDALVEINQITRSNVLLDPMVVSNLELLENDSAASLMFSPKPGGLVGVDNFADHLRGKKVVVVYKGSFDPITIGHLEIMRDAVKQAMQQNQCTRDEVFPIFEISLNRVGKDQLSYEHLAHNVQMIGLEGWPVMVTKQTKFYQLSELLADYTALPINFVMGLDVFNKLNDPTFYQDLEDSLNEGQQRLYRTANRVFVAPRFDPATGRWDTVQSTDGRVFTLHATVASSSSEERALLLAGKDPKNLSPGVARYILVNGLFSPN